MELSIEHLVIFLLLLAISYLVYKSKNTTNNSTIGDHNQITLEQLKDAVKELERATNQNSSNMNEMYTLLTKGGSVAGKFGEINLKTILESAGFKGVTYDEQKGVGGSIPDIVIKLPDSKKVIIDSKVSLADYNDYLNAKDDIIKDNSLKKHQMSVKNHIKSLSSSIIEVFLEMTLLTWLLCLCQ